MPSIWLTGISHSLNSARLLVLFKLAHQQLLADLFLSVKPVGSMAAEAQQELLLARQPVVEGLHGVVADLVVVAHVANAPKRTRDRA